jgi:hypothetical protein
MSRGLTIGSSDRGCPLRWAKEEVDDWDKSASLVAGEAPRRSTSSLGPRRASAQRPPLLQSIASLCILNAYGYRVGR